MLQNPFVSVNKSCLVDIKNNLVNDHSCDIPFIHDLRNSTFLRCIIYCVSAYAIDATVINAIDRQMFWFTLAAELNHHVKCFSPSGIISLIRVLVLCREKDANCGLNVAATAVTAASTSFLAVKSEHASCIGIAPGQNLRDSQEHCEFDMIDVVFQNLLYFNVFHMIILGIISICLCCLISNTVLGPKSDKKHNIRISTYPLESRIITYTYTQST